jgi:hypothetical protein
MHLARRTGTELTDDEVVRRFELFGGSPKAGSGPQPYSSGTDRARSTSSVGYRSVVAWVPRQSQPVALQAAER